MNNIYISGFIIFILSIYTIYTIYYTEGYKKLLKLFMIKSWVMSLIITILWSIYIIVFNAKGLVPENDVSTLYKYKKATRRAIIAFLIALFAYLDLTFSAYWLVWIVAFYIDQPV